MNRDRPETSLREPLKAVHDELDLSQQDPERDLQLAELGPLNPTEVLNSYKDGRLEIVLNARMRGVEGEPREHVAICKRAPSSVHPDLGSRRKWSDRFILDAERSHCGNNHESVLVGVVEVSEDGEKGGRCFGITSIVRLQTFDLVSDVLRERIQTPALGGEIGGLIDDGEHKFSSGVGRIFSPDTNRDAIDEVIEDASEVMDAIASDQTPLIKWQLTLEMDAHKVGPTFRVLLTTEGTQVCAELCEHGSLEGLVVFLRPIQLLLPTRRGHVSSESSQPNHHRMGIAR